MQENQVNGELHGLAGAVANLDQQAAEADGFQTAEEGGAVAAQPGEHVPDYQFEAEAMMEMAAGFVAGVSPTAGQVWTPEAQARVAKPLARVMEKYGWGFGTIPPELALIIAAAPLVLQTVQIMKMERAAAKASQVNEAPTGEVTEGPEILKHPQTALFKG